MVRSSPLRHDGLLGRAWPFAVPLTLAFASLPFVRISQPGLVLAAGVVSAAIVGAVVAVRWERVPAWVSAMPALAVVAVVFLLREGTGGLADPVDYEPLLMVPVLWLALYGSRRELLAVVGLGCVSLVASVVSYHHGGGVWWKAVIWPAVMAVVGLRVQALVLEVQRLSQTDPLTGVANRARWDLEIEREAGRAARSGRPLTVALIDIDFFKEINDRHGHRAGDQVLRDSAAAWQTALRASDRLARYGGDEFGLLLPETELAEAREVLERVRAITPNSVSVSIGVAEIRSAEPVEKLLARADGALYESKRAGRGRVSAAR